MKHLSHKPFLFTFILLLMTLSLFSDAVYAGRSRGSRGGGGARSRVQRSGGSRGGGSRSRGSRSGGSRSGGSRGGGASRRVNSGRSLQNQGNFSNSRQQNRGNRQGNRQQNLGSRQQNLGSRQQNLGNRQNNRQDNLNNRQQNLGNRQNNRQDNLNNRQDNRQQNLNNRQDNRQQNLNNRQNNRQDFVNDNWRGGGWYGGGYYAPPGWGAWSAAAGFTAGVVLGATVSTPPPYYDTVSVGSSSYIYSDGVYLQPNNNSYVVISPPVGVVVSYLPDGCNAIQQGNVQYYDCAGIYYQTYYQNGSTVYQVVEF